MKEIENSKYLPDFSMVRDKTINPVETCEFFCKFKSAIINNSKTDVAKMVKFPLKTLVNKKRVLIKNKEEFIRNYDLIINSKIKKAIEEQDVLELWGSWQGVMVGKGEVWISKANNEKMKVIAILNGPSAWISK